jgi:hypothetical protein
MQHDMGNQYALFKIFEECYEFEQHADSVFTCKGRGWEQRERQRAFEKIL